jgi:hypothetical protein
MKIHLKLNNDIAVELLPRSLTKREREGKKEVLKEFKKMYKKASEAAAAAKQAKRENNEVIKCALSKAISL